LEFKLLLANDFTSLDGQGLDDGKLVAEIIPELWLMDYYNVQLTAPYEEEHVGDLAVLTAKG